MQGVEVPPFSELIPAPPIPNLCPSCAHKLKEPLSEYAECPHCHCGYEKISNWYKPWPAQRLVDGVPHAPQLLFHTSGAKYRLEVGGYGSGKSKPLLMEAILHCLEHPGAECIILRKTVPDLKRTVISKFESDIPKTIYQHYNKSDRIVYFHPDPVTKKQSKLYFGACERDEDVGKYLSTEWLFIGFEELGEFSFAIWDAFVGRNRCPIPGTRPCMAGATNPMGIGWAWIKKMWVDKVAAPGMDATKYNPNDYFFIHSTVDDNPIYSQDAEYVRMLESSPKAAKIRWGLLETVTGQYFDNWEPRRHIQPRSAFIFQPWQTYAIGHDYGFGHFAVLTWLTKAILKPQEKHGWMQPRLVNVITRELILHERTPKEQIEACISSIPRDESGGYTETVEAFYLSWERFNRTVSNFTVADEIGDLLAGAGLPRPLRSNTDRIAGWQKIYSLLDTDELFVLDECPGLSEAIPLAVRDPVKLEDVVKPKGLSQNDDILDSFRYNIAGALLDADDKPEAAKFQERMSKIKDPLRRHIEQFREFNERKARERKGNREVIVPSWRGRIGGI